MVRGKANKQAKQQQIAREKTGDRERLQQLTDRPSSFIDGGKLDSRHQLVPELGDGLTVPNRHECRYAGVDAKQG